MAGLDQPTEGHELCACHAHDNKRICVRVCHLAMAHAHALLAETIYDEGGIDKETGFLEEDTPGTRVTCSL